MNEKLFEAAKKYIKNNISIVATDATKRALFTWKKYQSEIITVTEIEKQLQHPKAEGLAVICGKVSGNLEVIDVDLKNDITGNLYSLLTEKIPEELFNKLKVIQTKSGGYHFYYRCEKIEGNQKFSMRAGTPDELKITPHLKEVVLIESRGEAGYVIAPPTNGYNFISGKLSEISIDERESLLEICRSFNEVVHEKIYVPQNKNDFEEKCWDDYNKKTNIPELLSSYGWTILHTHGERTYFTRPGKSDGSISGDYHSGLNLFKAFTTSCQFEVGKGYSPFGIYCLLSHNGDSSSAAKELIRLGYGEKKSFVKANHKKLLRKYFDAGYSEDEIKEKLIRTSGFNLTDAEKVISDYQSQCGKRIMSFWDVDEKGKITIVRNKLASFLKSHGGFSLYFFDKSSTIFKIVRTTDGLLEEVSTEKIKKFLINYIKSLEPLEPFDFGTTHESLIEIIHKGANTFFSDAWLEFLEDDNFDFIKDEKNKILIPFQNKIVEITKDDIQTKSYAEVNKVIWKSQVIKLDVSVDSSFDPSLCEFNKFIEGICNNDTAKINYCYQIIGYLLHKMKDASRPFAIVFAEETDDEEKGGGSGKGILVKAISHIIKTERVDGKNFKPDKNFAFQRMGLDTKLIAIEDVRKNFDFEGYYSVITEGITIEKKNKDELFIPYSESAKILFTTNYTIPSKGVHAKRRQRVFEFSSHYNNNYTPADEFGHLLFDDWDDDEWNRFYNLMFYCCQRYLKEGIIELNQSDGLKRKYIRVNFSKEFLQYFDDFLLSEVGSWVGVGDQYTNFLSQNNFDKKDYSIKRFKKALEDTCKMMGLSFAERRNRSRSNLYEFKIEGTPVIDSNKQIEYEAF